MTDDRPTGRLPPEVEAELRRRQAAAEPGMGRAPLSEPAASGAGASAPAATPPGLFCRLIYHRTGGRRMLALADTSFFTNLFNRAPVFRLDGGWITGAIWPRIWLIGIVGMIGPSRPASCGTR